MPTIGWEARREGIDDYRYLQMLKDCLDARPNVPAAVEAQKWLSDLRERILLSDPHQATIPGAVLAVDEYDQIREKAAGYIELLDPVPADRISPEQPSFLKDEAKPFRGKSVQECLAGLESNATSVRRAAAWALFEKGPEAAPAVTALTKLLDDGETRIPAMRALEAIGPEALLALPKLKAFLKYPDKFVREGATFAIRAIDVKH